MKFVRACVVPVSAAALLLLAGCGGDSSGSSGTESASATASRSVSPTVPASASASQAGQSTGLVGATLTTPSGIAVTLEAISMPDEEYDPLGEERQEGEDPIQGYRAVLNATVVNGSGQAISLFPDDVELSFFTEVDDDGQPQGEPIACAQVFAAGSAEADRAPGAVASGAGTPWRATFVCPGQRPGTPVEAVYLVGGAQLTFTGELP